MLDRPDPEPVFFAPFVSSLMKVEPQWIDYNGHLNMAYYNVLFDRCVDEAYELIGCGLAYLEQTRHSTFTAEVHVRYLRELLVDAPSAGEGYWNQRSKSRRTFEGHWTRTGDKYVRDADGRYTFCGRSDDMFKVSGIWVSPFEVESALITHPAVLEAAVVPEADGEGLLKPKAFVVLRAGAKTDGLDEALKEYVKQKIGVWKYPRWIETVDALPKTATGKIQRFKLREGSG